MKRNKQIIRLLTIQNVPNWETGNSIREIAVQIVSITYVEKKCWSSGAEWDCQGPEVPIPVYGFFFSYSLVRYSITIVFWGYIGVLRTYLPIYKVMFVFLKGATNHSLPYIVFGAINLVVGVLTLMLPETKGLPMPATIQEAKDLEAYAKFYLRNLCKICCCKPLFKISFHRKSLDLLGPCRKSQQQSSVALNTSTNSI